jgi:acylphosphatase
LKKNGMKINRQVKVLGRVQGVFFRQSTLQKALELGIHGWVKNEADGSVLAEIEGNQAAILEMVKWFKSGPPMAKVENIFVTEGEQKGYQEFLIIR